VASNPGHHKSRPTPNWSDRYTTIANSLDMPIIDLNAAVEAIHALIDAIDTS
jgi:hypothetical protein